MYEMDSCSPVMQMMVMGVSLFDDPKLPSLCRADSHGQIHRMSTNVPVKYGYQSLLAF